MTEQITIHLNNAQAINDRYLIGRKPEELEDVATLSINPTIGNSFTTLIFQANKQPDHTYAWFYYKEQYYFYFLTEFIQNNSNAYEYRYILDCKTTYDILQQPIVVNRMTFNNITGEKTVDVNYPNKIISKTPLAIPDKFYIVCTTTKDDELLPKTDRGDVTNFQMIKVPANTESIRQWQPQQLYLNIDCQGRYNSISTNISGVEITKPLNWNIALNKYFDIPWINYGSSYTFPTGTQVILNERAQNYDKVWITNAQGISRQIDCKIAGTLSITITAGMYIYMDVSGAIGFFDSENNPVNWTLTLQYISDDNPSNSDSFTFISPPRVSNPNPRWGFGERQTVPQQALSIVIADCINDGRDVLAIQQNYLLDHTTRSGTISNNTYDFVDTINTKDVKFDVSAGFTPDIIIAYGTNIEYPKGKSVEGQITLTLNFKPDLVTPQVFISSNLYPIPNQDTVAIVDIHCSIPYNVTALQDWSLYNSQADQLLQNQKEQLKFQHNQTQISNIFSFLQGQGNAGASFGMGGGEVASASFGWLGAKAGIALGASVGKGILTKQNYDNQINQVDFLYRTNLTQLKDQPSNLLGNNSNMYITAIDANGIFSCTTEWYDNTLQSFLDLYGVTCKKMEFAPQTEFGYCELSLLPNTLDETILRVYNTQLSFFYGFEMSNIWFNEFTLLDSNNDIRTILVEPNGKYDFGETLDITTDDKRFICQIPQDMFTWIKKNNYIYLVQKVFGGANAVNWLLQTPITYKDMYISTLLATNYIRPKALATNDDFLLYGGAQADSTSTYSILCNVKLLQEPHNDTIVDCRGFFSYYTQVENQTDINLDQLKINSVNSDNTLTAEITLLPESRQLMRASLLFEKEGTILASTGQVRNTLFACTNLGTLMAYHTTYDMAVGVQYQIDQEVSSYMKTLGNNQSLFTSENYPNNPEYQFENNIVNTNEDIATITPTARRVLSCNLFCCLPSNNRSSIIFGQARLDTTLLAEAILLINDFNAILNLPNNAFFNAVGIIRDSSSGLSNPYIQTEFQIRNKGSNWIRIGAGRNVVDLYQIYPPVVENITLYPMKLPQNS